MATCLLYAVGAASAHGFVWEWRASDGQRAKHTFVYFHDCMQDARSQGHQVDLPRTIATLRKAPLITIVAAQGAAVEISEGQE